MGDKATLTKARLELEELYAGVPDDSVNLTFKDLAGIKSKLSTENSRKSRTSPESVRRIDGSPESGQRTDEMVGNHWKNDKRELIYENSPGDMLKGSSLSKSESLDFMKGLRASQGGFEPPLAYSLASPIRLGLENGRERSSVYDEASAMDSFSRSPYRKRPGIPHTNICTLCSAYIYMFKHRCLVCGRVYCGSCVRIGMGEMTEGRKCIDCLGRRFSQRYIQRAGNSGCCIMYPSSVKLAEMRWAEKGPRRSRNRYGPGSTVGRPLSPIRPGTPRSQAFDAPSFVLPSPSHPHQIPF